MGSWVEEFVWGACDRVVFPLRAIMPRGQPTPPGGIALKDLRSPVDLQKALTGDTDGEEAVLGLRGVWEEIPSL